MDEKTSEQFIYIVQAKLEPSKCKIGKTNNLERRLREYNSTTGTSKENPFEYLFACSVADNSAVENAIKDKFDYLREEKNREIYFYNQKLFATYVTFIKEHNCFIKEIEVRPPDVEPIVKLVKKITPSLAERDLTSKELLDKSQKVKNDEFYTRLEDIEKELPNYPPSTWTDKTVFCNCDDAVGDSELRTSAFATYFIKNFKELGLKKLICTHYGGENMLFKDIFHAGSKGYIFTKYGFSELEQSIEYPKGYNGSFDHELSIKILKEETDIVVTNPPFSRAVDFWKLIIDSKKQFIIISNITNPVTKSFITYFKNRQVWAGYNRIDYFLTPKRELCDAAGHWYTNVEIIDRPKHRLLKIVPLQEIPTEHIQYDDMGLLLVSKGYIPSDYKKPFGVSSRHILNGVLELGYSMTSEKEYYPYVDGKRNFAKVLVQKTNAIE